MKILFFGQLRERLGVGSLELEEVPETVAQLLITLQKKGDKWQQVLAEQEILVAVNQSICGKETSLDSHDEVALFPPVTGG